jgi:N-acetylglutamate synthase-like GNAT family acetyltransferase
MNIRKAQIEDIEAIHNLVTELAIFENEPDAVQVSVDYYKSAFIENVFQALVAEESNKIIGIAVYYMCFSTWKGKMMYLEDFVVKEKYRSSGIGQQLWNALINDSKAQGAQSLKWQVLDWNTNAIRFYERNGAYIEKEWWNGRLIF